LKWPPRFHESLVAPFRAVTDVAGTSASPRYVECGPKLDKVEDRVPGAGCCVRGADQIVEVDLRILDLDLAVRRCDHLGEERRLLAEAAGPPDLGLGDGVRRDDRGAIVRLGAARALDGMEMVSPLIPTASGTCAGSVAASPEVLLRSVIESC